MRRRAHVAVPCIRMSVAFSRSPLRTLLGFAESCRVLDIPFPAYLMFSDLAVFWKAFRSFEVLTECTPKGNVDLCQLNRLIQDFNSYKGYQDGRRRGRLVAFDGGTR